MKRKASSKGDAPSHLEEVAAPDQPEAERKPPDSFTSLNLDTRLLQALAKENIRTPTAIQWQTIPLALAGKDIFARSRTGSGKTAAYLLPLLQSLLQHKSSQQDGDGREISALILTPTKELASQVHKAIITLTAFCGQAISAINLAQNAPDAVQRAQLAEFPDIVVSTPSRAVAQAQNGQISSAGLRLVTMDEADLMSSYGYADDLQTLAEFIATGTKQHAKAKTQVIVVSATLPTDEMGMLRSAFGVSDPAILDIKEDPLLAKQGESVRQYVVRCGEDEKFLLAYVVFKLKLIKGKCIIFVGDVDRSYRLKLYFEQFGIRACVLNSELPVNSRIHVVEEFNKSVYDIIIASDEHDVVGDEEGDVPKASPVPDEAPSKNKKKSDKQSKKVAKPAKENKEFGISRGIDFKNVACVLNFDFPTSSTSYTHRIGRTARAGQTGMALSFIIPRSLYRKDRATTLPSTEHDEQVLERVTTDQAAQGREVHPYHFDMPQVNAFRYRMNDALRAVTGAVVREARARELRQQLLNSDKLATYFEEHPADLASLRFDHELRTARAQPHLRHVPEYLMPSSGAKGLVKDEKSVGFVPFKKRDGGGNRIRMARMAKSKRGGGKLGASRGGRRSDSLKTFRAGSKR